MQIFVMILAIICEKIALNKPHIVQVTAHIRKRITQIPTADEPEMQKKKQFKEWYSQMPGQMVNSCTKWIIHCDNGNGFKWIFIRNAYILPFFLLCRSQHRSMQTDYL